MVTLIGREEPYAHIPRESFQAFRIAILEDREKGQYDLDYDRTSYERHVKHPSMTHQDWLGIPKNDYELKKFLYILKPWYHVWKKNHEENDAFVHVHGDYLIYQMDEDIKSKKKHLILVNTNDDNIIQTRVKSSFA